MSETQGWTAFGIIASIAIAAMVIFAIWYGNASRTANMTKCIEAGGTWLRADCLNFER